MTRAPVLPILLVMICKKAEPLGPGSSARSPEQRTMTTLRTQPSICEITIESVEARMMNEGLGAYTGTDDGDKDGDGRGDRSLLDFLTDMRGGIVIGHLSVEKPVDRHQPHITAACHDTPVYSRSTERKGNRA